MAGRKTKLTDPIQKQIVKLLKTGVTIADACSNVGIAQSTYFDWLKRGEAGEAPFAEFSKAVSRAHNDAKVAAIETLRTAMSPYKQKSTSTKTYTETRVVKDRSGNIVLDEDGQPRTYEYKEVTTTNTVTLMQGDFHAAIEYLKRRFPEEWSDRLKIEDWRSQAIADIRAGKITPEMFPDLVEAFDKATAEQLFAEAGIAVTVSE